MNERRRFRSVFLWALPRGVLALALALPAGGRLRERHGRRQP